MPAARFARLEEIIDGRAARSLAVFGVGPPGFAIVAALGVRFEAEKLDDLRRRHLKLSLRRRISPNTSASLFPCISSRIRISALSGLRNGLVLNSSSIVVGKVISPLARSAKTRSARCWSVRLEGSMVSAKRALASVYSCPT